MTYHSASQAARAAYDDICEEAGSTVVAEENAALSIGREFLPPFALAVLDKRELTAHEEIEYYEWLTDGVQMAIDENSQAESLPFCACGRRMSECDGSRVGCRTVKSTGAITTLERSRVVGVLDTFASVNPGRSMAACYSIELGWFMAGWRNPPSYHATADEARAAAVAAIERGDV
jgi:hypothetical protein